MRVLLVEDDQLLGEAIHGHAAALGHALDWTTRLDEARLCLSSVDYELLLLDLNLPDGRGMDLLRELRARGDTLPVIILSAQDQIASRIAGLDAGADDYLVKPFDLNELSSRISAVARRYSGRPNPTLKLQDVDVEIDLARRSVAVAGQQVDLTAREWVVLERIARRPNGLVSRSELETSLFAMGAEVESNAVEVYVSRLRRKIGHDAIKTVRGLGYKVASATR